jgi:hypothetical protein
MKSILILMMMALTAGTQAIATQTHTQASTVRGEKMMKHAQGSFVVKVKPEEPSAIGKEGGVGRMTIDKVLSGDLAGTSKGEMLTSQTESTGAMGYVAVETVTATLDGRSGTFVFLHNATMNKSDPKSATLNITVVPGSGTGGLAGIGGTFTISIDGAGKHTYTFDYELP